MTRLGASPPSVCICGHLAIHHYQQIGRCDADVYRQEIGRSFGCFCPQFEIDGDR